MTILQLERFKINVIVLCFVIPNSVSEARVFFSARVGVRDLLFLFAIDLICENPVRHAACRTKSLRSRFVPFAPKSITRFRPLSSSTVPVPNLLCLTRSPIENTVSFSASCLISRRNSGLGELAPFSAEISAGAATSGCAWNWPSAFALQLSQRPQSWPGSSAK
jgi:hypothetical protein